MANELEQDISGQFRSPGGFVFGVQGWNWGDQRRSSITFFLDGRAKVCDQHGRPIKGTVRDNKPVYFDRCSHEQVIAALAEERVDWMMLSCAGWPQLPYEQLKKLAELKGLPPTPLDELKKITDSTLRKDALRIRREVDEAREKELQAAEDELSAVPPPQSANAVRPTGRPGPTS